MIVRKDRCSHVNRLFRIEVSVLFYVCSFYQMVKTRTKVEQIEGEQCTNSVQIGGTDCSATLGAGKPKSHCTGLKTGCRIV